MILDVVPKVVKKSQPTGRAAITHGALINSGIPHHAMTGRSLIAKLLRGCPFRHRAQQALPGDGAIKAYQRKL
jgi:hypothetical protein